MAREPQSDFGYSFEKVQELSPGFSPQRGVLLRWGALSSQVEEGAAHSQITPVESAVLELRLS